MTHVLFHDGVAGRSLNRPEGLTGSTLKTTESQEATSISFEGPPIIIAFNEEVSNLFHIEVQRMCRV